MNLKSVTLITGIIQLLAFLLGLFNFILNISIHHLTIDTYSLISWIVQLSAQGMFVFFLFYLYSNQKK